MKIIENFKYLLNTFRNLFSACFELSEAAKLNSQTEMLEALQKHIEMNNKLSQLDDIEVEKIKELLDSVQKKQHERRLQLALISFPVLFLFVFLLIVGELFVQFIR